MIGVLLRLSCRPTSLKSNTGSAGAAVAGGHGYEFHEIERDVFIATRTSSDGRYFGHECLQEQIWLRKMMIAKGSLDTASGVTKA
jgi:hypothetical protein